MKGRRSEGYVILGFRVPMTSVGAQGEGARGSKGYVILGFRVPTTSVGTRGEGAMRSKGGNRGARSMLY